jgi:hypothetical protein
VVKVLLADPALAALADRFADRLPDDVAVVAVTDFSDDEFRRLAADATVLVNARRPIDAATLAMAPAVRFIQIIGAGTDTLDRAALADAGVVAAFNQGLIGRAQPSTRSCSCLRSSNGYPQAIMRREKAGSRPQRSLLAASRIWRMQLSGSWAWATSGRP